jgi:hypothetical protein
MLLAIYYNTLRNGVSALATTAANSNHGGGSSGIRPSSHVCGRTQHRHTPDASTATAVLHAGAEGLLPVQLLVLGQRPRRSGGGSLPTLAAAATNAATTTGIAHAVWIQVRVLVRVVAVVGPLAACGWRRQPWRLLLLVLALVVLLPLRLWWLR